MIIKINSFISLIMKKKMSLKIQMTWQINISPKKKKDNKKLKMLKVRNYLLIKVNWMILKWKLNQLKRKKYALKIQMVMQI